MNNVTFRVKTLVLSVFAALCISSPLSAGTIGVNSGSLQGVITFDASFTFPTVLSINGTALVDVFDGSVSTIDIVTDFGAPAPNLVLTAVDAGLSEFVNLYFDPFSMIIAGDLSSFSINATGVPSTAISDPGLAALINTTTWVFGFSSGGPGATDITYDFVAGTANDVSDVPEPTSVALTGLGLLGLLAFRRRRN